MAHSEADIEYMCRAIELARRGTGFTNPNPLVGAVLVRDGEIIAEGWHARCGDLHAERAALANCRARNISHEGATLYVTLEPCCHTGKQPPCTEAVIESGIAHVVVGSTDPNPLVAGRGCEIVRVPEHDGRIDLRQLMAALGKRGIDSVFIEGGATLAACALEAGIVNHVQAFIAPKIFAGVGAPSPLGGTGVESPDQAWMLSATTVERLGDDVLIEGDIVATENATPEHATTAHDDEIANAAPKEDARSQD